MKIMFFSPYSDIWVHSHPETAIALECRRHGHDVMHVGCGGLLVGHCAAMTASRVGFDAAPQVKLRVCATCKGTSAIIGRSMQGREILLSDLVEQVDRTVVDEALKSVSHAKWMEFSFRDIPVGRFATYEFFLTHKINSPEIPAHLWDEYMLNLRHCLMVQTALVRLLEQERPDRIVVYNSLYSLNRTVIHTAKAMGVEWRSIHGGRNVQDMLQTITVTDNDADDILAAHGHRWQTWKDVPLRASEVKTVEDYLTYLFSGTSAFVYSAPKAARSPEDLSRYFGIARGRKVLLAVLSSADERFAADMVGALPFQMTDSSNSIFKSTEEWLSTLVSWIDQRDEYHLIIRLHPREFPNKRESVLSPRAGRLLEVIPQNHPRISTNLPTDEISLYDLAAIVDVVLNSTSNSGAELMALGLPVVIFDSTRLFSYPPEHNYEARSINEYFDAIDNAATEGWSLSNAIKAFRYRSFLFNELSISMHDVIPKRTGFSLHRVVSGLRARNRIPVPVRLVVLSRRLELSAQRRPPVHGARIVRGLIDGADATRNWPDQRHRDAVSETALVRASLRRIAARHFRSDASGSLGWKIRRDS